MAHWGWEVIIKGSSWTKTIVVEATVFLSSGMGLRIASSPCLFYHCKNQPRLSNTRNVTNTSNVTQQSPVRCRDLSVF